MLLQQQSPAASHCLRVLAPCSPRRLAARDKILLGASRGLVTCHRSGKVVCGRLRENVTSLDEKRHYSSKNGKPREIAVVGGGMTGMATAYFLAEAFPKVKIKIFESKNTLGGWIKSKPMTVKGDGEIIFEQGPRSLRPGPPNGTLALRLVQELGLVDELLFISKSTPAAQNRFIYYPDHLARVPGPGETLVNNLKTFFLEPVFRGVFKGLWKDINTDPRGEDLKDESVGSFISRRFSKKLADNIASAGLHGIYAGDIYQLSMKSILGVVWEREAKYGDIYGGILDSMMSKQSWAFCDDVELMALLQFDNWAPRILANIEHCSVFTLKRGLGQLAERLEQTLEAKANVTILKSTNITLMEQDQGTDDISITHTSSIQESPESTKSIFSHVISTVASNTLINILQTTPAKIASLKRSIGQTKAVTVMVVNLYYRTPNILQSVYPENGLPILSGPLQGFGYLIPRSIPFSQNPERALGVIFDSDIAPDLWTTIPDGKVGTKLTIMMGGHWWDDWTEYPSAKEAEKMAMDLLERHLNITEKPALVNATLQENCIPQYTVGHTERMAAGHDALVEAFDGRIRVAGSWYGGVGVNDCVRGAFDIVKGLVQDLPSEEVSSNGLAGVIKKGGQRRDSTIRRGERTGLQSFKLGRPMVKMRRSKGVVDLVEIEQEAAAMGFFEEEAKLQREARERR